MKKSTKVEHGFKVTSDGRLIIREDEEEDVKDKGKRNFASHLSSLCTPFKPKQYFTQLIFTLLIDKGEINDILEEAGVKSVSIYTCNHNI